MAETTTTHTSVTTSTSATKPASDVTTSQDAHLITSARHTGRADPTGRARHELEQELQRQQRFASDLSHELRSPMTGLRTELEEARLHRDQTDLEDLLDRMLDDVDRLEAIITDALLLARLEAGPSGQPRHVDLTELVRAEIARRRDPIAVQLRLEPGVMVDVVPTRITQILTNLLDNAQRHTERTVRVHVHRDAETAELSVARRTFDPACEGWYPKDTGRKGPPRPVMVDAAVTWPGKPIQTWPAAVPGQPWEVPTGQRRGFRQLDRAA